MSPSVAVPAELETFRSQFPVLQRLTYLNAGTEGPVPRETADAVSARVEAEAAGGRCGRSYHDEVLGLAERLRSRYAGLLGCSPSQVALTGSTTDGVNTVIAGLDLKPGDEILTSEEEHPGLLAPLGRARLRHGVTVRTAPFAQLVEAVTSDTRLVACSHVSWVNGQIVDAAGLKATGVPVLLDGAQGIGAVPVDVEELGCAFYAASGQKWLCGPEGSGCLYVRPEFLDDLLIPWPGYGSLSDALRALELPPADGAARLDHGYPAGVRSTYALASLGVLERAGWEWVHKRAATLADMLAQQLADRSVDVQPRGHSTLVSWTADDAPAVVQRLAEENIVVRSIPAFGLVRASVGAWTAEAELERLVGLVGRE
jgi:L-cysteine/cystine lyase